MEAGVWNAQRVAKRRVFVIDDHPIVRSGLAQLMAEEPDLVVCGESAGSAETVDSIAAAKPDVVLLDISLGGSDGLRLLKAIRARSPRLPVLMLSMHDELTYAERALRAGANGYVMKQEATDRVLFAVRRILSGGVYLSDRAAGRMVQQYVHGQPANGAPPVASLSDRELQVFRLMGEGRTTRQIAQQLSLSVKTVETYQAHIKDKLALRNSRELVHSAIEWHLTEGAR